MGIQASQNMLENCISKNGDFDPMNEDFNHIRKMLTREFMKGKHYTRVKKDGYTDFSYPKIFKLMRFHVDRFWVDGFGHFMLMHTKTKFGMELLTASFMPGEGGPMPYSIVDYMKIGKKRTIFIEYYECGTEKESFSRLEAVHRKYACLTDCEEKPHWYVSQRAPYSLIKCGRKGDEAVLADMLRESVRAYRDEIKAKEGLFFENSGLREFRERMIKEGNPSSSVLEKVFGKERARKFFLKCVMPIKG